MDSKKGRKAISPAPRMKREEKNRETTKGYRNGSGSFGGPMIKKVTLYSDPKDPYCAEIEKFLRGFEVTLKVHDLRANPLNVYQLSGLLKHFDIEHFLNGNAKSAKGKAPDFSKVSRQEVIDMIAADNSLLRKPIIVSGRLITFGYDRQTIMNMLQLRSDSAQPTLQAESAA